MFKTLILYNFHINSQCLDFANVFFVFFVVFLCISLCYNLFMNQVLLYAFIVSFALIFGAILGIYLKFRRRLIAAFMAYGSGVLICALTFGLMEEAFSKGGFDAIIFGFLSGGTMFIFGNYLLYHFGGREHKYIKTHASKKCSNGKLMILGAVLDGVPESMALGIALFVGGGNGFLTMIAIFLSNFPESISSVSGLKKEGFSKTRIVTSWSLVALISFVTVILSYLFLNDISPNMIGCIESFAAGAILAMLADSMMPEAYEEGGYIVASLTIFGFLSAFILSRLQISFL